MRNLHYAFAALVALPLAAGCGDDPVKKTYSVAEVAPSALDYAEVCDESSSAQNFTVRNAGTGMLNAVLEVVGENAAMYDVNPKSLALSAGASQDITVTYHPSDELAGGASQLGEAHNAVVNVTYTGKNGQTTEQIVLSGAVADVAVEPVIAFECGDGVPSCSSEEGSTGPCCNQYEGENGRTLISATSFHNVLFGGTSQLPVKVKNLGCANLDVSQVDLNLAFNDCAAGEVRVATAMPLSIPRNESREVMLEFAPSLERATECQFTGSAVLSTNDTANAPTSFPVGGAAVKPKLVCSPRILPFGDVPPGQRVTKTVECKNTGTFPIEFQPANWSRPSEAEFSIASIVTKTCDGSGNELSSTPVTLPYTLPPSDVAPCGQDEITITFAYLPVDGGRDNVQASFPYVEGSTPGSADITMTGGSNSEIVAVPETLMFQDPVRLGCEPLTCGAGSNCAGACDTNADCANGEECIGSTQSAPGVCTSAAACVLTCGTNTKTVTIRNDDHGPLHITGADIKDTSGGPGPMDPVTNAAIFSIEQNGCLDQTLEFGESCNIVVRFTDKNSGGNSAAALHVYSDDSNYPDLDITIISATETDLPPQPTFKYTGTGAAQTRTWVRLDAGDTTDDHGIIANYEWRLFSAPSAASYLHTGVIDPTDPNKAASCDPSWNPGGGGCFRVLNNGRTLEFYPDLTGEYQFRLKVTDAGCNPPHTADFTSSITVSSPN